MTENTNSEIPTETPIAKASTDSLTEIFVKTNANLLTLVEAVQEESAQRSRKIDVINRFTKIAVVLIVLVLCTVGYQIFNTNMARQDRQRQFVETVQNQKRIEQVVFATGACAITANKSTAIYDKCLKSYGFQIPEIPVSNK